MDGATRSAHLVTQLLTLARAEPESVLSHDRKRFDLQRMAQDSWRWQTQYPQGLEPSDDRI